MTHLNPSPTASCVICDCSEIVPFKQIPFATGLLAEHGKAYAAFTGQDAFYLFRCTNCHLIFLYPIPSQDFFNILYGVQGTNPNATKADIDRFARDLEILAPYQKFGPLLEVGLGDGTFIRMACKNQWDVYGLDLDFKEAQKINAMLGDDRVQVGTLINNSFPEASFGSIHLSGVLEHLPDPSAAISGAVRLLKPGGVILFASIPNIEGFYHKLMDDLFGEKMFYAPLGTLANLTWVPPYHIFYFNQENLKLFIEKCGLQIIENHCRVLVDWESYDPATGPEGIRNSILDICQHIRSDKRPKNQQFKQYYNALASLLLQTMSWSIAEYMNEIELALDNVSELNYLAQNPFC